MRRIAVTLLMVLLTTSAFAAGKTVPRDEYKALVRESRNLLGQREVDPAAAKRLALQLRNITSVTLPNGQVLPVETKSEADALDAITGTTPDKKLSDRFAVLDEQLRTDAGIDSKTDPQALARTILAAHEFDNIRPKSEKGWGTWKWPNWNWKWLHGLAPVGDWFAKIFKAMGKWMSSAFQGFFRGLGKFFRWIFRGVPPPKFGKVNPLFAMALLARRMLSGLYFVATVAAVVAIYFLVRQFHMEYERRNGRGKGGAMLGGDLDLSEEGITDPFGTAKERAAQGDYRTAIRLTYIASLWRLGDSGLITLEKNRTNWEYQRSLRKTSQKVHDDLLPATRLFDRTWYGKQSGTQTEFEMVSAIYEKLPAELVVLETAEAATPTTTTPTGVTPA